MEEFLHGTQFRLKIYDGTSNIMFAEWHVRDFIIRHKKTLGLSTEDVLILENQREYYRSLIPE
jgi:hypothetical protein